ncbi:MAG: hypothetical protein IH901_05460 [Proteobacteria bacterium]|nr:hypothetical protein [Pseudomonadota bacterium]
MASKRKPAKPRVTPAVYFSSLSVENVRCFGAKQTLDLTDSKGNPGDGFSGFF